MTHTEARKLANQFGTRMCDENGETHNEELYCFDLDDIIAIKEALAQPEQEPVAWLYRDAWGTMKLSQVTPPPVGAFPVYTAPPQRKEQA